MIMNLLLAVAGLVLLVLAGDALVKGAVNLALRIGMPAFIVSLTIVAFGTSAPEMLVSIDAVISGVAGLAMGNVVGSNTANILLVLGLPALIYGLDTSRSSTKKTYSIMLAVSVLFIGLSFFAPFSWWHGLVLLAVLVVFLGDQYLEGRRTRVTPEDVEGAAPDMPGAKVAMYLIAGLVGLPLGAHLLTENAKEIAEALEIPDAIIGLTLVAIGTSLPELATTLAAAKNRQADVALGNAIGSNIFNLLAIIGVTALVGDIPVEEAFLRLDLWVMLAASVAMAPFVFTRAQMGRAVGLIFCALYGGYLWMLVG